MYTVAAVIQFTSSAKWLICIKYQLKSNFFVYV